MVRGAQIRILFQEPFHAFETHSLMSFDGLVIFFGAPDDRARSGYKDDHTFIHSLTQLLDLTNSSSIVFM